MNYEEKYKAALGWMRKLYPSFEGWAKEDAEHYFPELKESEDEKIKKAIIAHISYGQHFGVSNADMITWLEKQGKGLDADKVIEWLEDQACQGWIEDVEVSEFVDKFKKHFKL